ncbi:MAG: hypothetical protein RLZZ502_289, partial [Pseudomonadota bacterium]
GLGGEGVLGVGAHARSFQWFKVRGTSVTNTVQRMSETLALLYKSCIKII